MAVKNALIRETGRSVTKVWVHNNQLIMVPFYTKKQFEQANIGFVCHSPFPSSTILRMFKHRNKILESLLHCDLVAFLLFMYANNFIKTVQRSLGLELEYFRGGLMGLNFNNKNVIIRVSHIGIEESLLEKLMHEKQFEPIRNSFRNHMLKQFEQMNPDRHMAQEPDPGMIGDDGDSMFNERRGDPIIMSSIDSYHPISGLKHKLTAYHQFLQKYPTYRDRVVFIQFVGSTVQAFDEDEGHQRQVSSIKLMRDQIMAIVEQIQREFGKSCLMYMEQNPSLHRRLALWTESDIIWCSSLKDGLCM